MENSGDLQNQVYETMQLKETEELLEIWKTNDRKAWTADAFLAIEKILIDRLGSVPPQSVSENDEDEDAISRRLLWISSIAEALSYLLLIIVGLYALGTIVVAIASGALNFPSLVIIIGAAILIGLVNFVILQFVAKGSLVLLEIRDNTAARI